MIKVSKTGAGFTLIEILVYLALFAIFVAGAVLAAFNIIESGGRNQTNILLQEEGSFLVEKFEWALSSAQNITSPAANTSGPIFTVNNFDGSTITLSLVGSNMQIQDPQGTYIINNSGVKASCPNSNKCFSYNSPAGSGVAAQNVEFNFTLTANTGGGLMLSQSFSAIKYLRK